jgi:hypothetical protein
MLTAELPWKAHDCVFVVASRITQRNTGSSSRRSRSEEHGGMNDMLLRSQNNVGHPSRRFLQTGRQAFETTTAALSHIRKTLREMFHNNFPLGVGPAFFRASG